MELPKLENFDLKGKRVLVRADLDVPLERVDYPGGGFEYKIKDETRLLDFVPTVKLILEKGAKFVVLLGHLGRFTAENEGISTWGLLPTISDLLGEATSFWPNWYRDAGKSIFDPDTEKDGRVHLFENLRMYSEEERNDLKFAKILASFGDFYVNDALAVSHRSHASIVGIPQFLPHAAGLHLVKEVEMLSRVLEKPKRPVVIVIGGAKEDKLALLPKFLKIADFILIGGWLVKRAIKDRLADNQKILACLTSDGRDITVESAKKLGEIISRGGTVVWNGPMGIYEDERDLEGTKIIAEAIVNSGALKIAGGGDTEAVINLLGLKEKFDWISSGGGAMLEFLAEGDLPGIEALKN